MALLEPLIDKTVLEHSSHIHSRGYSAETRTIAVMFKDGTMFHHHDAPPELWEAWLLAESAGKFYHSRIRGKFPSVKMSGHCPTCGALGIVGMICVDCGCADVVPDPIKPPREPKGLRKAVDSEVDALWPIDARD